jgi:hypothetical protein
MAIAGVPAMAFRNAHAADCFGFYRRSQLQPMSLAAKMRAKTASGQLARDSARRWHRRAHIRRR